MANSPKDQPIDNASTHDGLDGEDKASNATDSTTKDSTKEEVAEYPPPAQGALVMLALLLALFLSALVNHRSLVFVCDINSNTHRLTQPGPHNHRNRHPSSHRRIRLTRRHRLVRKCLSSHIVLLHTLPRPRLHLLSSEVRLPLAHRGLRDRIGSMRFCTQLGGFHHWPCDRRNGCCGHDVWRHGPHDQRDPFGEKAGVDGRCGCDAWCC
jgi:hypothetical protein